jgi:hypothetical protein
VQENLLNVDLYFKEMEHDLSKTEIIKRASIKTLADKLRVSVLLNFDHQQNEDLKKIKNSKERQD